MEVKNKIQVLEEIVSDWNKSGIKYAIIHGVENYPSSIGRDIDIFIDKKELNLAVNIALRILVQNRFSLAEPPKPWGGHWIFGFRDGEYLILDFMHLLFYGPILFSYYPNTAIKKGPFYIDPWASFVKRIIFQIFNGDLPKPPFITKDDEKINHKLESYFGYKLTKKLLKALETNEITTILKLAPKLKRIAIIRSLIFSPWNVARLFFPWLLKEIRPHFTRVTPIVGFVGPDGAGKSIVIKSIEMDPFVSLKLRHWRPNILPRLGSFLGKPEVRPNADGLIIPRRTPGKLQWVRRIYYWLDFILGHYLKDTYDSSALRLVVYDRYAIDVLVDPVRYGLKPAKINGLFYFYGVPKLDLIVLFFHHSEIIHNRKKELPIQEIKRQVKEWMNLYKRGRVHAIIKTDGPITQISEIVRDLIQRVFLNKWPVEHRKNNILWLNSIFPSLIEKREWDRKTIYYGLFLRDGRAYLFPKNKNGDFLTSLKIYSTSGFKGVLMKNILKICSKFGCLNIILSKVKMNEGLLKLFSFLKDVLNGNDLEFSISLGTPGPFRKPVLQIYTPSGRILGYAKIGWNKITIETLENEKRIIQYLQHSQQNFSFLFPTVIYSDFFEDKYICIFSSPNGIANSPPTNLDDKYIKVLEELSWNREYKILTMSSFWRDIKKRISNIKIHYFRQVLENGVGWLEEKMKLRQIPFTFMHGDFAPWNTKLVNNRMYIYDWEWGYISAPIGMDLVHFIFQRMKLLEGKKESDVVDYFRNLSWEDLKFLKLGRLVNMKENSLLPKDVLLLNSIRLLSIYALGDEVNLKDLFYLSNVINILILENEEI